MHVSPESGVWILLAAVILYLAAVGAIELIGRAILKSDARKREKARLRAWGEDYE